MSDLIDISAALVASPRPCAPITGARLHADDAQPRLRSMTTPTAHADWRLMGGTEVRGFETIAKQGTQDGRTAFAGAAYVTTNQHRTRSGPPTSRQPA